MRSILSLERLDARSVTSIIHTCVLARQCVPEPFKHDLFHQLSCDVVAVVWAEGTSEVGVSKCDELLLRMSSPRMRIAIKSHVLAGPQLCPGEAKMGCRARDEWWSLVVAVQGRLHDKLRCHETTRHCRRVSLTQLPNLHVFISLPDCLFSPISAVPFARCHARFHARYLVAALLH